MDYQFAPLMLTLSDLCQPLEATKRVVGISVLLIY